MSEAKREWSASTNDELLRVTGRREILAVKIQEKYGIALTEANKQIDAWAARLRA